MYKILKYKDIQKGIDICLEHQLYVEGWSFYSWFIDKKVRYICVVYKDDNPIGCGVKTTDFELCGVYVKPEYRNKGIGKRVVKHLIKNADGTFTGRGRKLYNLIMSETQ
jgi:GNAT superfamily N-acetyltransferase